MQQLTRDLNDPNEALAACLIIFAQRGRQLREAAEQERIVSDTVISMESDSTLASSSAEGVEYASPADQFLS